MKRGLPRTRASLTTRHCASRSIARLGAALIATISLVRVDMEKGLRPNSRSTSRHHRNFSGVRTLV